MDHKKLSVLSDQELLDKAKKVKSNPITYALLIGFLIGVIIYSIVVNSLGFFTLIPLYFIYKLIKNSEKDKALDESLKERNLK